MSTVKYLLAIRKLIALVNKSEAAENKFYCNFAQPQNFKPHFTVFSMSLAKIKNEIPHENYGNERKDHTITFIFRSIPKQWPLTVTLFAKTK